MGIDSYIKLVDDVLETQSNAQVALVKARTAALSPEQEAELALAKAQLEETLELSKEVQEAVEDGYGYDNLFYEDDLRELALQLRANASNAAQLYMISVFGSLIVLFNSRSLLLSLLLIKLGR
jgi:hypothetical protein